MDSKTNWVAGTRIGATDSAGAGGWRGVGGAGSGAAVVATRTRIGGAGSTRVDVWAAGLEGTGSWEQRGGRRSNHDGERGSGHGSWRM